MWRRFFDVITVVVRRRRVELCEQLLDTCACHDKPIGLDVGGPVCVVTDRNLTKPVHFSSELCEETAVATVYYKTSPDSERLHVESRVCGDCALVYAQSWDDALRMRTVAGVRWVVYDYDRAAA